MVIFLLDRVCSKIKGEISKWLIEPKSGVFIGILTKTTREKLWEKICKNIEFGSAIMIYKMNKEQGFDIEYYGNCKRKVIDYDGLKLISKS
ncbi:MAG TPA: type I-E CRISPR-associated endoribonuclease Cas2e [bacterium]|jgi:CRISPR-associated protein Cas2|nr:type I-E CRISPR-associated endoribonuclease Cas2e [bacterium]